MSLRPAEGDFVSDLPTPVAARIRRARWLDPRLVGGIVRLIPAGDKVERIFPRWNAKSWQLLIGPVGERPENFYCIPRSRAQEESHRSKISYDLTF